MSAEDRKNPLAVNEDFYIPYREPASGSFDPKAESDDVEYMLKNLYAALRIPKEYLGHDD